jgi:hypothetical protein
MKTKKKQRNEKEHLQIGKENEKKRRRVETKKKVKKTNESTEI